MNKHSVRQTGQWKDGGAIHEITVQSLRGDSISISEFGARLTSVRIMDASNRPVEVTLGYGDAAAYMDDRQYIGTIVGPYANRISGGGFDIGGSWHALDANHGDLHIHGGSSGFHNKKWTVEPYSGDGFKGISCYYRYERGLYPANIDVTYTIEIRDTRELVFDFHALCDAPCPLNLTNHAYWNLDGEEGRESIGGHYLEIPCDRYLEADKNTLPTGKILSVNDTVYDMQRERCLNDVLSDCEKTGLEGIDTCYVIHQEKTLASKLSHAARARSSKTGIAMAVSTSFPAVQVYTANNMGDVPLRDGTLGKKHNSLCLETQYFSDSVNHDHFPNTIFGPDVQFHERTVHQFSVEQ